MILLGEDDFVRYIRQIIHKHNTIPEWNGIIVLSHEAPPRLRSDTEKPLLALKVSDPMSLTLIMGKFGITNKFSQIDFCEDEHLLSDLHECSDPKILIAYLVAHLKEI